MKQIASLPLSLASWRLGVQFILAIALIIVTESIARAAEYQWSVPVDPPSTQPDRPTPRAFLWIPPICKQVRAVVVGQHNMLEENLLEHAEFRKAMSELNVAEIWISPMMDGPFDPEKSGPRFEKMMKALADESGYRELEFAPIAPIGHSACASYPWNFAAWAPQRTLCALSIHGDAPQTPLAGYGKPNPGWGDRNIDGVPGLMVMAEYEWIEARLAPATVYHTRYPKAPIAVLAEPGVGHFAGSDDLVRYLAMFVRKCVEQRLPALSETPLDKPPVLKPIDPSQGWLVQRWTLNQKRTIPPAPFNKYAGDPLDAFWAFDEEMALATQNYRANQIGKRPQLIDFVQEGKLVPIVPVHAMVNLKWLPQDDGETFKFETRFLNTVTSMGEENDIARKNNHIRWSGLPAGAPIGHAPGTIKISRIEGPIEQVDDTTFRLSFYRGYTPRQAIWLAATHPGDDQYKSAVQQASMPVKRNDLGVEQTITFDEIPNQKRGVESLKLSATSSAGLPVHFFIREGPAEMSGETLKFLPIPGARENADQGDGGCVAVGEIGGARG